MQEDCPRLYLQQDVDEPVYSRALGALGESGGRHGRKGLSAPKSLTGTGVLPDGVVGEGDPILVCMASLVQQPHGTDAGRRG